MAPLRFTSITPGYKYTTEKKELKDFCKFDRYVEESQRAEKKELQKNINMAARLASVDLKSKAGLKHVIARIDELSKNKVSLKETAPYLIDSLLHHFHKNGDEESRRALQEMLHPYLVNVFKRALCNFNEETRKRFANSLMTKRIRTWKGKGWFQDVEYRETWQNIIHILCICDPDLEEAQQQDGALSATEEAHPEDEIPTHEKQEERKLGAADAARALVRMATQRAGGQQVAAPATPAAIGFVRAPGTPGMPLGRRADPGLGVPPTPDAPGTPGPSVAPATPAAFFKAKDEKYQGEFDAAGFRQTIPATPNMMGLPATPRAAVLEYKPGVLPATPMPDNFRSSFPITPVHEAGLPTTPGGRTQGIPSTPRAMGTGPIPSTPRGAAGPIPSTPMGAGHMPATPRAGGFDVGSRPIPSTPRGAAQPIPSTPRGAFESSMPAPFTPGLPQNLPSTPGGMKAGAPAPFTPAGIGMPAPFTPAVAGKPAPFTPAGITGRGTAAPFTPAGPAPFTPAMPGGRAAPFTPATGASAPFTPAGPGSSAPFTPAIGASAPFTPGMSGAPRTPAMGGFAAPFTPGMSGAPQTPGMPLGMASGNMNFGGMTPMPMPGTPGLPALRAGAAPGTPGFMPVAGGERAPQTPAFAGQRGAANVLSPTAASLDGGGSGAVNSPISPALGGAEEPKEDDRPGDVTPTTPAFLGKVPDAPDDDTIEAPSRETPALGANRIVQEDEEERTVTVTEPTRSQGEPSYPEPTAEATPIPVKRGEETPLMMGEDTPLDRSQQALAGDVTPALPGGDFTPRLGMDDVTPAIGGDVTPGMPTVSTEPATLTRPPPDDEEEPDAKRRRVEQTEDAQAGSAAAPAAPADDDDDDMLFASLRADDEAKEKKDGTMTPGTP